MLKGKHALFSLAIIFSLVSSNNLNSMRLSDDNYQSASVLPVITFNNHKSVILSQEAFGASRGTYDDFSGGKDRGETHPLITAAREFYEEAILKATTGLTLAQVTDYIDISKTNNTECIVSYSHRRGRNVTYITNFDMYKTMFLNNFYQARKNTTDYHSKEKDRIALVKWSDLEKTFAINKGNKNVTVEALELDPTTKTYHPARILLRPYFIKKLRPFFLNQPYTQGLNKKIRFYRD